VERVLRSFTDSFEFWTDAALQRSIASRPAGKDRHRAFILGRLVVTACILISAPLFLFFHGAPTIAETVIFFLAQIPLIFLIVLSRTGALRIEFDSPAAARVEAKRATIGDVRLLANVSHELRTPLNAIIGFSQMLANEGIAPCEPAKQREYASIISASGRHLLEVIDSILDASKIEAGAMQIELEPFPLQSLADQCCDMMQLMADQSGVTLSREYASALGEIVADKRALKQILINLLSNAVKFTPPAGTVRLLLRLEGNQAVITVADTGVGIAPNDLERLGDPFFRARAPFDRGQEGTGLGLSVIRGLVGLHGGSITIESGLQSGTAVTVRLPRDCGQRSGATGGMAKIQTIARTGAPPNTVAAGRAEPARVKKIA